MQTYYGKHGGHKEAVNLYLSIALLFSINSRFLNLSVFDIFAIQVLVLYCKKQPHKCKYSFIN